MHQRERILRTALRQVPLFRTLDDPQLHSIEALCAERRYRRGEVIFHQGDPGGWLYVIDSGYVRIYVVNPDGREMAIRVFGPGSAFGELSVIDGKPRSATAAALRDVSAFVLYREDVRTLLQQNSGIALQIIEMLAERLRFTTTYSQSLAFLDAPERVASVLVQLSRVLALDPPIRLELTQQDLAEFANTTREWINRTLHTFAENNWIRIERGAVVVSDIVALERYAESQFRS